MGYGCASKGAKIRISRCVHIGTVARRAGGITGERFGTSTGYHWDKALNCEIDQCIQIGDVNGDNAGGLCGVWTSGEEFHITNSYVVGNISNEGSVYMGHTVYDSSGTNADTGFYIFMSNLYHIGTRSSNTFIVRYLDAAKGSRIHMENVYSTPISSVIGPVQTTHGDASGLTAYPEPTHDINSLTLGTVGELNDSVSATLSAGRTFSYTNTGGAFEAVAGSYPILTAFKSEPFVNYTAYNSYTVSSPVDDVIDLDPVSWVQIGQDIDGEAQGDLFGRTAAMLSADATVLAIGARDNDANGSGSGHVRVFDWSNGSWVQKGADIDGEATGDWSGQSLSLSADGSIVAIGAFRNDGNGTSSGHVRVYRWSGSAWVRMGTDIDGEASQNESGFSVSLSANGSILAVGAPRNDQNGTDRGHARVYEWSGSAWV